MKSHDNELTEKSVVNVFDDFYMVDLDDGSKSDNGEPVVMSAVNELREPLLEDCDVN